MQLFNDTPLSAQTFQQVGVSGILNAVVVARGKFVLKFGSSHFQRIEMLSAPTWHDVFETTARGTSLVDPGDMAPFKPCTDVTVVGAATSDEPRSSWPVSLQVGGRCKTLRVHGERYWEPTWKGLGRKTFSGWRMTEGVPSTSVPLTWERAFGGGPLPLGEPQAFLHSNPVGMGVLDESLSPRDRLISAPQIEADGRPIEDWTEGYLPAGMAPIAPWWSGRQCNSGTYDEKWQQTRAPFPPIDFKYDFWQAAPQDQQFRPWLFGNETIRLSGFFARCPTLEFGLPLHKIFCLTKFRRNKFTTNIMFLDGVHVELEDTELSLRLSWRASFPVTADLMQATIATIPQDEEDTLRAIPSRITHRASEMASQWETLI